MIDEKLELENKKMLLRKILKFPPIDTIIQLVAESGCDSWNDLIDTEVINVKDFNPYDLLDLCRAYNPFDELDNKEE